MDLPDGKAPQPQDGEREGTEEFSSTATVNTLHTQVSLCCLLHKRPLAFIIIYFSVHTQTLLITSDRRVKTLVFILCLKIFNLTIQCNFLVYVAH